MSVDDDIRRHLKAEGYSISQLTGPVLYRQITKLIRASLSESAAGTT